MDDIEVPEEDDGEDRSPCGSCGRRFKEEALIKHEKVCKKVFASKRKTFDSKKKRIIDSEHASILKHKEFEEKKKAKLGMKEQTTVKKPKWKKQSEELRAIAKVNTDTVPTYSNTNGKFQI